jgi:hypothetical protein
MLALSANMSGSDDAATISMGADDEAHRMVQRALEEELTCHLGYAAGQGPPGGTGNPRNAARPRRF